MSMILTRRAALGGLAAGALLTPSLGLGAASGARRFRIIRDGDDIGRHDVTLTRSGDTVTAEIDISIKIKVLGITAYRYTMKNRETYTGGKLITVDSKVNDDGDAHFCTVRRSGDALKVEGSEYTGDAPGDAATTSYWSTDFLTRRTWISTQTGRPLKIAANAAGAGSAPGPKGRIETRRFDVTGDFEVTLHYVGNEWVSCAFDAGGELAEYKPDGVGSAFGPVWSASL